jgi:hypothetical protein
MTGYAATASICYISTGTIGLIGAIGTLLGTGSDITDC